MILFVINFVDNINERKWLWAKIDSDFFFIFWKIRGKHIFNSLDLEEARCRSGIGDKRGRCNLNTMSSIQKINKLLLFILGFA